MVIIVKKKLIIISIILLALDQISKALVMNLMTLGQSIKVIPSFFYLTYIQNDGAALNILSGDTFILITISLIALLYIIKLVITSKDDSMFQTIIY